MAQMPAATGGIYHHSIASHEGQAQVIAHELFTPALEADFHDVKPGK